MATSVAPEGRVTISVISRGECKSHTARSLLDLTLWDSMFGGKRLQHDKPFIWVIGAAMIVNSRNTAVRTFLESSEAEWLLMLDDDQLYPPTLLEQLVRAADPVDRPIMGAPVWRFASKDNGPVRVTHNVFDLTEDGRFVEWGELPKSALVQVGAVGTGCLLVHRSALERIREWSHEHNEGRDWAWFRHNIYAGRQNEGEDLFFARIAAMAGLPVFINTELMLDHIKQIVLNGPLPEGTLAL